MMHASVQRWLEQHTPIEPSLLQGAGLELLIEERLSAFGGVESAYLAELARSSDEVDHLIASIAVPETWLFRYPRSFDLLLDYLRSRLGAGTRHLRMLSIGCATGQEPYCMAMTALHAGWPADRIEVEGIDRNAGFLNIAERGEFGASSVRTEVPPWAAQFLRHENESIAIDPAVRAVVRFRRADVTRPEAIRGTGPWNVVYCRNLLIYLNMSAREKLLESICTELSQDGLLFVGHAEQMIRCSIPLRIVPASHAFALQPMHPNEPPAKQPGRPARSPKPVVNTPRPPTPAPHAPMPATTSTTPPPLQEVDWLEDARVVADSGRATQAEEMIHAIITKRGPSAAALELLGMIRMSVNDTEGAKRLFEQALYLEQNRLGSLLQLAMISEKSGDERRAAKYWDRAKRASTSSHEEHRA